MRLAVNGVWGNLGVASAALITGYFIDHGGWRAAFVVPGIVSVVIGILYALHEWPAITHRNAHISGATAAAAPMSVDYKALLWRVSLIVFATTAISSLIFQATTFALPKIFDERLQGMAKDLTAWLSAGAPPGGVSDIATTLGALTFMVFAVASMAQLVVGSMLDRYGPRIVFLVAAAIQVVFFAIMPGLSDVWAFAAALGFMFGAFGQIPINDFMIGKMASGPARARIYGVRYVLAFSVLALSLPLIGYVYENHGFDALFRLMAGAAAAIFVVTACLPSRLPTPEPAAAAA
jgi:MFS family permease